VKEKYLWISLMVIAISWIMNFTYYQSKQLDEPIFLTHYYETQIYDVSHLTLYYLTNKNDPSHVTYVEIDGRQFYPQNSFSMWSENTPQYDQDFRHHFLKSVVIEFPKDSVPIKTGSNNVWSFEEMKVGFNDGRSITKNIGKVRMSHPKDVGKYLESRISSSSNQHRSEETLVALEPITIGAISVPFLEVEQDIEVKVNLDQEKLSVLDGLREGKDVPEWDRGSINEDWKDVKGIIVDDKLFPLTLDKHDWIKIMIYTNPNPPNVLDFSLNIKGTDANGKPFTGMTHVNERPYLEQKDVDEIIAAKKEEKTQ
jgi:hypothetical protein